MVGLISTSRRIEVIMGNIPFVKMHGLGNDFVLIDNRNSQLIVDKEKVQLICNRHSGVGCDQLLIIDRSDEADVYMKIFNPNGKEAEACGNGARCAASYVMEGGTHKEIRIKTISGIIIAVRQPSGEITIDMGKAKLDWQAIPLSLNCDTLYVPVSLDPLSTPVCVNIGNPHAIFFVNDVNSVDLELLGPQLENHEIFPEQINVEIVSVITESKIRMRVWERGVGITLACGSGACAAVVGAYRRKLVKREVTVELDGGTLDIKFLENGHVTMTGPTVTSFTGLLNESFLNNY